MFGLWPFSCPNCSSFQLNSDLSKLYILTHSYSTFLYHKMIFLSRFLNLFHHRKFWLHCNDRKTRPFWSNISDNIVFVYAVRLPIGSYFVFVHSLNSELFVQFGVSFNLHGNSIYLSHSLAYPFVLCVYVCVFWVLYCQKRMAIMRDCHTTRRPGPLLFSSFFFYNIV